MLKIRHEGNVAVIALDRPPVNAIHGEFVRALEEALVSLHSSPDFVGVVLTSTSPKVFSSGLDLRELAKLDRIDFERFVQAFSRLMREIFDFPKPLVSALTGHAIAGGCLLASATDRVLLAEGAATVGLAEARLGVPIPAGSLEILRYRLGDRALAEVVLGAENHAGPRALSLGLVDAIVAADRLEEESLAVVRSLAAHPGGIFTRIKSSLRRETLRRMTEADRSGIGEFVDAWFSPSATAAREAMLASLKKT